MVFHEFFTNLDPADGDSMPDIYAKQLDFTYRHGDLEATIVGTVGDDVIVGTSSSDVIVGLGGADTA